MLRLEDHLPKTNLASPLEGISAVYYINMERSKDREANMQLLIQDPVFQGIPVHRVEAVDGTRPDTNVMDYVDFHKCGQNPRMMSSEYGCTVSHFRAIHQFAMTEEPIALVVEDDLSIEFLPFFKRTLGELAANAPADWEVIQLSYILFDTMPELPYEPWEMKKNFCGTAAYMITNEAAKRLIGYLCKNSSPAMPKYCFGPEIPYYHHTDRFLYSFLRTYSFHYPPFTYRDNNDSCIHPDHVDFHAESKEKTKNLYLKFAR